MLHWSSHGFFCAFKSEPHISYAPRVSWHWIVNEWSLVASKPKEPWTRSLVWERFHSPSPIHRCKQRHARDYDYPPLCECVYKMHRWTDRLNENTPKKLHEHGEHTFASSSTKPVCVSLICYWFFGRAREKILCTTSIPLHLCVSVCMCHWMNVSRAEQPAWCQILLTTTTIQDPDLAFDSKARMSRFYGPTARPGDWEKLPVISNHYIL